MAAIAALDDVFMVGAGTGGSSSRWPSLATRRTPAITCSTSRSRAASGTPCHLIWSAVQRLRELGVPSLNLGGGVREGDDVAEFKRRFGAAELPLASLRQVYRPERLRARSAAQAGVTSDRSGWFPPYRAAGRAGPAGR